MLVRFSFIVSSLIASVPAKVQLSGMSLNIPTIRKLVSGFLYTLSPTFSFHLSARLRLMAIVLGWLICLRSPSSVVKPIISVAEALISRPFTFIFFCLFVALPSV